jgi:hypothetical protein
MTSESRERHKRATAAVFGVLLIGVGVLFLLQNFGYIDAGQVGDWWPLILIGLGIASLIAPKDPGDSATGVAVAALGAFFLLRNFDIIHWRFQDIWPAFLVLAGISLIARSIAERRSSPPSSTGSIENGSPR